MIDITDLRKYYESDAVLVSDHAAMRFRQRGLKVKDIRCAVNNGEIIEQYPDDFPFPSCLILGKTSDGRYIHVVMSDEGNISISADDTESIEKFTKDMNEVINSDVEVNIQKLKSVDVFDKGLPAEYLVGLYSIIEE